MESASSRWSAHSVAKSACIVRKDVSNAFMVMSEDAVDATNWNVFIMELKLKDALKRVSTQIENELQVVIACIKTELERDDREVVRNVATCRVVKHNCVGEARRSLTDATESVAGLDVDIAIAELGQSEDTVSNQAASNSTETGGTEDQR